MYGLGLVEVGQLPDALGEALIVLDVVSLEDLVRLVTNDRFGCGAVHAGINKVSYRGSSEIMNEASRIASTPASVLPRLAKVFDRRAILTMEDPRNTTLKSAL